MSVVWKFQLPVEDATCIPMPTGARVLCVAAQHGEAWIWAICDPDESLKGRWFYVRGTGHPLGDAELDGTQYIGTFQLVGGEFVGHVFEAKR